ncbi:hypothetical protein RHMOL_Rhmol11G0051700 [Rhododendron molle]|uniref:Uncharacterized protein n=1 Tax=Rhododendron molle TaxID=49168 RepID=A0ACC0LPU9_RHOML|nr:hypothetical protein RHMOL_Rhmol11G0051700 [Rhododendron molle]
MAGPLGIRAFREMQSQAYGAAKEMRATGERQRGGEGRMRRSLNGPVRGGPPELLWRIAMVDNQGNLAEVHLAPARVEPTPVTISVPIEWGNEAVRRMLAMEKVIRRAASGIPLELHYPAPTPPLQLFRGLRKRTQSPLQNEIATRTTTPLVTTRRQTRSSQPMATSQDVTRAVVAHAEQQYQIKMRQNPTEEEPVHKKLLILPKIFEEEGEEEKEEEEEEEQSDEERSSTSSGSDDSNGAIPLPENEEEDGDEAVPVLVQIAPPDDAEFVIEEIGEEPEGNPEEEPMEEKGPEKEPMEEGDPEEWEIGPEEWEIELVERIEPVQEPEVMDILFGSGDVPPPPYETDIGMYVFRYPDIFWAG